MENFEYKVIPAPRRGVRTKGAKGSAGKFAGAMEKTINELAMNGWEYLRAESLPVDERHGITRRVTEVYQNVLIFRKPADEPSLEEEPVAALLEDQSDTDEVEAVEEDGLFDDINDDFPDEEGTGEEVTEAEDEPEPEEDTKKGKKS